MLKKTVNFWIFFLISIALAALAVSLLITVAKGFIFLLLVCLITLVNYFLLRSIFQHRTLNDKASKLRYRH